jgi:glutathione S-transferase
MCDVIVKYDAMATSTLLDLHLLDRTYLVGDALTLADIALSGLLQSNNFSLDKVWSDSSDSLVNIATLIGI